MKISAVKLYENGFMTQALACGGEGMDGIDPTVRYRSSLQNYVIDTGDEVILVDTGKVGIPMEKREFHCKGEFKGMHKGRPNAEDLKAAADFARSFPDA